MTAIRDEEAEDLAYELRRRVAPILGNAELALEGAFGPVTPEQRDALEEIVGSSEELGAVIAHAFEADDVEEGVDPDSPLPTTDPDSAPPIALSVENGFDGVLAAQLERSGHEVLNGDPAGTPHHAIVDCGVPTRADLEAIRERACQGDTLSLTVVSTIDAESVPAPVLGVSAIVSPTVSAERLREELPEMTGDGTGAVAVLGPVDERLLETLSGMPETSTVEVDPAADGVLETIAASGADVAVLEAGEGTINWDLLAALRDPSNPGRLPVLAVGPPPTGEEWVEVTGHDQFAHRPLSAVELAGEVLTDLSRGETIDG